MSYQEVAKVYEHAFTQGQTAILLAMAENANEDGRMWPSVGRIAWKAVYSERHVQRILNELKDKGILVEDGTTEYGVTIYRIDWSKAKLKPPYRAKVDGRKTRRKNSQNSPVQSQTAAETSSPISDTMSINEDTMSQNTDTMSDNLDAMSPKPSLEPLNEPSIQPSVYGQAQNENGNDGPDVGDDTQSIEKVIKEDLQASGRNEEASRVSMGNNGLSSMMQAIAEACHIPTGNITPEMLSTLRKAEAFMTQKGIEEKHVRLLPKYWHRLWPKRDPSEVDPPTLNQIMNLDNWKRLRNAANRQRPEQRQSPDAQEQTLKRIEQDMLYQREDAGLGPVCCRCLDADGSPKAAHLRRMASMGGELFWYCPDCAFMWPTTDEEGAPTREARINQLQEQCRAEQQAIEQEKETKLRAKRAAEEAAAERAMREEEQRKVAARLAQYDDPRIVAEDCGLRPDLLTDVQLSELRKFGACYRDRMKMRSLLTPERYPKAFAIYQSLEGPPINVTEKEE